jgi:dTMP kinase
MPHNGIFLYKNTFCGCPKIRKIFYGHIGIFITMLWLRMSEGQKKVYTMNPNGKIIAVEGTDKAGKHTQVMLIMEYLKSKGISCETLDFPQYSSYFGKLVKDYLNGNFGQVNDLPPEYSMLPYALDRLQHQPQIREWVQQDKWVILDRYSYSNLFSVAKCPREQWDDKIKYLEEMEFKQLNIIPPDYNIYLYLDPKISFEMRNQGMKAYQNGKADIHESNFKLLYAVSECYRMVAEKNPETWRIIDEMENRKRLSIDGVFSRIKPAIDNIILLSDKSVNLQKRKLEHQR